MLQGTGLKMPKGAFGRLLRFWRRTRELSQEAVGLEIGVSPRHISFMENGRSLPSQDMVIKLAEVLSLNIRETNNLLASAGFAPSSLSLKPESEEHHWLKESLIYTLRGLDPFPTAIVDQNGNAEMINKAWLELILQFVPAAAESDGFNLIDLIFNDQSFKSYLMDWEDTVCSLLLTLQQEVLMYQEPLTIKLLQRALSEKEVPADWKQRGSQQMNITGYMSTMCLPGHEPERHMHVFHTVGATSFVSEPKLMLHTIYPVNQDRIPQWEHMVKESDKTHPLLFY
ncbi:helix-turn-helix domain-containing protein [Spongorhabdus nitratireducens]